LAPEKQLCGIAIRHKLASNKTQIDTEVTNVPTLPFKDIH
jgi:hypothetical protein